MRLRIPHARPAVAIFGVAAVLAAAAPAVRAGTDPASTGAVRFAKDDPVDEEVESDVAKKILDFVCKDGGNEPYSGTWYRNYSAIEARAPFRLRGHGTIPAETRRKLYGEGDFNAITRPKMCGDLAAYAQGLKVVTIDLKGEILPCCATSGGIKAWFNKKIHDFLANNEAEAAGKYGTP